MIRHLHWRLLRILNHPRCPRWVWWLRVRTVHRPEKVIPKGNYCYTRKGGWYCCPFWSRDLQRDEMESGYCGYLRSGDWEGPGVGLLWDQCKECGVNRRNLDIIQIGNAEVIIEEESK